MFQRVARAVDARLTTWHATRGPAIVLTALTFAGCGGGNTARHEVAVPWALGGKQLVADLHTHTRFSDGALDAEALVSKSFAAGCQALAITDHSDLSAKAGTPVYLNSLVALRQKYPKHVLIGGVEWNVPPHQGRMHMGVLVDPLFERHLITFKERFEIKGASVADAFRWLRSTISDPTQSALIYNHPSRRGESAEQVVAEWSRLAQAGYPVIGFEGGPGHQKLDPNGAYMPNHPTEDRWDPVIVRVGGAWDQLLDRGQSPWAALANSDYHNPETEYTPCEFSRTTINVPEATASGVLKALHAGSFWASQGRFLDHLLFTANAPGLAVPAAPGETIRVTPGTPLNIRIAVERFAEVSASPLAVDVIGNCKSGKPEVLAQLKLAARQPDIETTLVAAAAGADGSSCFVRARVRGQSAKAEPALAYTNPIRIRLADKPR